jgi:hypothetical protein
MAVSLRMHRALSPQPQGHPAIDEVKRAILYDRV